MDFPLPIRSFISTTDFSTPLFIETNIVYNMDGTKFPGLHEGLHYSEPALIIDSDLSLNCNTWTERTETCDGENQDLYNIIDSWVVKVAALSPVDLIDDILDLPDIRLELSKYDMPVNESDQFVLPSACDLPSFGNVKARHLHNLIGESQDTLSSNISINQCDTINISLCESCRFPSPMKRKRKISSALQENITNSNHIEDLGCSKRRKAEFDEFSFNAFSSQNGLGSVFDDFCAEIHINPDDKQTAMFHFGLSPIKSLSDRQW